jgi:uroporphyrinogen-III synthase
MREINFEQKLLYRHELPLVDKHILFTTPRPYAGNLGKLLLERGARIIWMPTIEIWPMSDYSALDDAIAHLSRYTWVVFTSTNGIEAFFTRLHARGLNIDILNNIKTAALGPDAVALQKRGVKVDLIPAEFSPRGIVNDLAQRNIKDGRILLPVPQVIGVQEPFVVPELIEQLVNLGIKVDRVPAYETVAITSGLLLEKTLLTNGDVEMVIFTSSAEIFSLLSLLGERREVLEEIPIACLGQFTGKTAIEVGLKVTVIPEKYTFINLVESIEKYYRQSQE